MACSYCPQELHIKRYVPRHGDKYMSLMTLIHCLSTVPRNVQIIFAGMAEPWLNPSCTGMVLEVHRLGFPIGIYTTLSGMKPEDVELIRNIPFLHFCIHLPDSEGRMRLPITDEYLRTLKAAVEVIPHNFVVFGPLHPQVREVIGQNIHDSTPGLISRAGNVKPLAIEPKKGKLKCSACGPNLDHNVLLPNGDVLLCCMDYGQDHILGNLSTVDYESLFHGKVYRKIMQGLEDENSDIKCRRCEISCPA